MLMAGQPTPSSHADSISQGRAIVPTDLAPKVPGLAIAVSVGGSPVWSEAFGFADLEGKVPVPPGTGEKYAYSSYNWNVIGAIIEAPSLRWPAIAARSLMNS